MRRLLAWLRRRRYLAGTGLPVGDPEMPCCARFPGSHAPDCPNAERETGSDDPRPRQLLGNPLDKAFEENPAVCPVCGRVNRTLHAAIVCLRDHGL